jgi:hypothetical protein
MPVIADLRGLSRQFAVRRILKHRPFDRIEYSHGIGVQGRRKACELIFGNLAANAVLGVVLQFPDPRGRLLVRRQQDRARLRPAGARVAPLVRAGGTIAGMPLLMFPKAE